MPHLDKIGFALLLCLPALTGCEQEPIRVQHDAEVHHTVDKIGPVDINIRFPDRKPRNNPQR